MADDHVTITARRHAHLLAVERALRELRDAASKPQWVHCQHCERDTPAASIDSGPILEADILLRRPEASR